MDTIRHIWQEHGLLLLDITGTIIGLWYLWLEYRASIRLWLVGIIMPALYLVIYYRAGLYADFGLQVYYLLAALYGWTAWKNKPADQPEKPITSMPRRHLLHSAGAAVVLWAAIYIVLRVCTDSDVALCDSYVNALSIVALWMLARKYVEQWFMWIVIDAVSAALYVYKGIPFTAGLYALYAVIAVLGYLKWKKMMQG